MCFLFNDLYPKIIILSKILVFQNMNRIIPIQILAYLYLNIIHIQAQYLIPENYTKQTPIWFQEGTLEQLIFSPNQISMTYKQYSYVNGFKFPVLGKSIETDFSCYWRITDFQYSSKGDRYYLISKLEPKSIALVMYELKGGYLDKMTSIDLIHIDDLDFFSAYPQIDVSQTTVVIYTDKALYAVDISDIKNIKKSDKYSISDENSRLINAKCHPTQKDIILLGIKTNKTSGSFGIYNVSSQKYTKFNQNSTKSVGFMRNGTLALQELVETNDVAVYFYYENGTVEYMKTVSDMVLSDSLNYVRSISKNGKVIAGTSYKQDQGMVKIYEIVEKDSSFNENASLPNIDFELIFTQKFDSDAEFSFLGMSYDGNQIYLNSLNESYVKGNITRWRRCIDGTFVNDVQCWPCDKNCPTCHNSPTTCTSCVNFTYFKNYSCVDCQTAFKGCVQCDSQNCILCNTTARFDSKPSGNICYCKTNSYLAQNGTWCNLCGQIILGCVQCETAIKCGQCNNTGHFYLDDDKKCYCGKGWTLNQTQCVSCRVMPGCETCANTTYCTKCDQADSFKLNKTTNQCQCNNGSFLKNDTCLDCQQSIFNCQICSQDGKICEFCWSKYRTPSKDRTQCICIKGMFQNDTTKQCATCDKSLTCINCKNQTYCLECNKTQHFITDPVDGKCKCQTGYYLTENNTCIICQKKGCTECSSQTNCTKCSEEKGFDPTPKNNSCQCQQEKYPDQTGSACFGCGQKMVGCLSCSSLTECIKCDEKKNFTLNNQGPGCQCLLNYFLKDQQCRECQYLIKYCKYCTTFQNAVKCQACNDGFVHNSSLNQCQCPDGFVIENNLCYKKEEEGDNWLLIGGILAGVMVVAIGIGVGVKIKRSRKLKTKQNGYQEKGDGELRGSVKLQEDEDFSDEEKARKRLLASSLLSDATGARQMHE